jgi:hypothetical protein
MLPKKNASLSARTTPVRVTREPFQSKYATLSNTAYVHHHQNKYSTQFTPQNYMSMVVPPASLNMSPTATLSNYSTTTTNQFYNSGLQTRSTSMPSTPVLPKLQFNKNSSPMRRMYQPSYEMLNNGDTFTSITTASTNSLTNKALRDDLLIAADSLTVAMQDLVKELNSGRFSFMSPSRLMS